MDKENTQKSVDDKETKITDPELLKVFYFKSSNKERSLKKKRNKPNSTLRKRKLKRKNNKLKYQKKRLIMIPKFNITILKPN